MQPLPSLGQRRIAKQVRGELLCRGGQRPAALVDEGELAHRIETSNRHDTNLPSSGNGQLADEGKTTGGLYHAQHRGYGSKLHHHIHLDAQVAQCAVDDLTDGAAAFETDVVLAGEGLRAQLPATGEIARRTKRSRNSICKYLADGPLETGNDSYRFKHSSTQTKKAVKTRKTTPS